MQSLCKKQSNFYNLNFIIKMQPKFNNLIFSCKMHAISFNKLDYEI